ncbi:MAG: glutamine amidotransferase [Cyanobacteria bacterium J06642_2]
MPQSKSAIAIRHVAFEDLGSLAEVLESRGYKIEYLEAGLDDLSTLDSLQPDLAVILGGPIGAYDDDDYPFLRDEVELLTHRLRAAKATLGICLGAQLIARALGAKVYPGERGKEIGWFPIQLSEVGRNSALRPLADTDAVLHWHGDTFDLPVGCEPLASSARYENQAFSYKQNVLALQFHPEVFAQNLERWFIGHTCEIGSVPGLSAASLRQGTQQYGDLLQAQARLLWGAWLDQIESASGNP